MPHLTEQGFSLIAGFSPLASNFEFKNILLKLHFSLKLRQTFLKVRINYSKQKLVLFLY